jgi:hypothetical protein
LVNEKGTYEIAMKQPEKGYTAYFVEITFPGQAPIKLTTGVEVLPRTYPFESIPVGKPHGHTAIIPNFWKTKKPAKPAFLVFRSVLEINKY